MTNDRALNSFISHQECVRCGRTCDAAEEGYLCKCGGPLLVHYRIEDLRQSWMRGDLAGRTWGQWRYRELLPLGLDEEPVSLGEGGTPLVRAAKLGQSLGLPQLLIKDEGRNPAGSFKSRGASVGVSILRHRAVPRIAVATAGNTGSAWSAYAARAGIPMTVVMAQNAPPAALKDCSLHGADTIVVEGDDGAANRVLSESARRHGWFNASHGPFRVEGKKTIGFELVEQLCWDTPDVVLYPTGPGVGILALWKAISELQSMGWLASDRMPALVAVQSARCAPYADAMRDGSATCYVHPWATGVAPGIIIDKPPADALILQVLRQSGGTAIGVEDADILEAMAAAARLEGLSCAPEGAAAVAAAGRLREAGFLKESTRIVCINTASGLRYHHLVDAQTRTVEPGAVL